jgi:hypothetical protein
LTEAVASAATLEQRANGASTSPSNSRRARIIAFYLPQFHPIPENDEWWEKGFTEWTNVSRARPLFPGHVQPRIPGELGYYDLRVPEVRAQQAALAREYGIEGFCYWHYWFEGRRILERPFNEVLSSGQPDLPFCLGWANQSWTGIWHGAPDRILIEQKYGGEADARRHFDALLPAFLDTRYLRVDGRPIFVIHQPRDLPQGFTDLWQDWAHQAGLRGIYFLGDADAGWNASEHGFDGSVISALWRVLSQAQNSTRRTRLLKQVLGWPTRIGYREVMQHAIPADLGPTEYPTVLPNWDNTPRSRRNGVVITGSSPERFSEHLAAAVAAVQQRPADHRLVFLKSWNEWAEGNFVEPDVINGRRNLLAIQRVLQSANSNL